MNVITKAKLFEDVRNLYDDFHNFDETQLHILYKFLNTFNDKTKDPYLHDPDDCDFGYGSDEFNDSGYEEGFEPTPIPVNEYLDEKGIDKQEFFLKHNDINKM